MAVTSRKNDQGIYEDKTPGLTTYTPSQTVTDAQKKMQDAEAQKPGAYTPGQSVTAAQQALADVQARKPQGYNSKYGAQLDSILAQIQNPQDFKYEFNGDELFKYYADLYTQKGRQASMDAMGQAAALTGGYGNSYAQQVGQQAYDQYLLSLYDKGLDLRDRAYQQYQNNRADLYNQYNTLSGQDQVDYGRYRDLYGDWEKEREYYTGRYDNERNVDYTMYRDLLGDWEKNRDYYTKLYQDEASRDYTQYADQRDYNEKVREFDASLNWEQMSSDQKYAAQYAMSILANGQMPSEQLLMAAGLSPEDAQKMMAQLSTGSGTGGTKKTGTEDPTNVFYVDNNGQYYTYTKDKETGQTKRQDIDSSYVKNNDLVHNIYTEGAQRRKK